MKKTKKYSNLFFFFIMLCTVVCLTACGERIEQSESENDDGLSKLPTLEITDELEISQYNDYDLNMSAPEPVNLFGQYYVYDDVCLTADKTSYEISNPRVEYTEHNKTNSNVLGDSYFQLEILIDGQWYIIPPVNYDFNDLAFECEGGKAYSESFELSQLDVNYIEGKYRFIKEYGMGEVGEVAQIIVTSFEFDLRS